jgi:group I intron endonuclease
VEKEQRCSFSCINNTAPNLRAVMPDQGKIYCAHCIHSGKKYIGQTITLLEYRVSQHFTLSKGNHHKFANALKKYGRDGFIWGIIEECDKSSLNDREVYWIEKYNTFKKGYNSTTGGNQGGECWAKEYLIKKPDGNLELIENLTKYCRENNLSESTMRATLIGTTSSHIGYKVIPRTAKEIERYEETRKTIAINIIIGNEKKSKFIKENYSKIYLVQKPNGDREEIKNLSQYCRDNDLNIAHIHETLYGKRNHHKGYKLIPRTDEEIERYKNERRVREDTSRKGLPGEKNGRAILDWNKVDEIRKLHSSKKYKNQQIADMFGVKKVTIEKIVANKLWPVNEVST